MSFQPFVRAGSGNPEGAISAPVGSIWCRTDGGSGTSAYIKETGSGNTGWVPISSGASGAVLLTSASSQQIQPSADVIPLKIKEVSGGGSAELFQIIDSDGTTVHFRVKSNGRTGIGFDPSYPLDVNGFLNATGFSLGGVDILSTSSGWLTPGAGLTDPGSVQIKRIYANRSTTYAPSSSQITSALFYAEATAAGEEPLVIEAHSSQTANLLAIYDDGKTNVLSRFNKSGYFMTRKIAAPADADVATSEVAIWFDNTSGAAKVMFKGKDSGGTVRTGSVTLT